MPFCPNCGKEYSEGVAFCPNCGKPFQAGGPVLPPYSLQPPSQPPAALTALQRPAGVTILAALQIAGSLIMIGVGLLLGPFGVIVDVFGVVTLLFGLALLSGRNWARILVMIGAVLDILSIVGIIWGIILLWYFTRRNVVAYFKAPK